MPNGSIISWKCVTFVVCSWDFLSYSRDKLASCSYSLLHTFSFIDWNSINRWGKPIHPVFPSTCSCFTTGKDAEKLITCVIVVQIKKKGFYKKKKGKTNHYGNTTLRGFLGPKKEKGRGGTRTVTHEEDDEGHVSWGDEKAQTVCECWGDNQIKNGVHQPEILRDDGTILVLWVTKQTFPQKTSFLGHARITSSHMTTVMQRIVVKDKFLWQVYFSSPMCVRQAASKQWQKGTSWCNRPSYMTLCWIDYG